MAYERTIWKNREVERPRTFTKVENADGTITLVPAEGNIIEPGTPIIAENMNNIEQGIEDALAMKISLDEHLADLAYQTPVIVGTQIRISKQSNTNRLYFKLDADLTGGAITISTDNGATSKPLKDIEGNPITELEKGFVEVVADANFFILRPRGSKLEIKGQDIISGVLQETIEDFEIVYADTDIASKLYLEGQPEIQPTRTSRCIAFSPNDDYMAVGVDAGNLTVYKINGDVFTKLASPSSLPAGSTKAMSFSGDGKYLACVGDTLPYLTIYKIENDVFTKIANPSVLPTGAGYDCAFNIKSNLLAITHQTSPYLTIYKIENDIFTKLPNFNPLLTNARCVDFNIDSSMIVGCYGNPTKMYKIIGDAFNNFPLPASVRSSLEHVKFSKNGEYVLMSYYSSPYVLLYPIIDGWLAEPLEIPSSYLSHLTRTPEGIAITNNGEQLTVLSNNHPFITVLKKIGNEFVKFDDYLEATTEAMAVSYSERENFLALAQYLGNRLLIYKNSKINKIYKGTNSKYQLSNKLDIGYVKKGGVTNEVKDMIRIFK